MSRPTKTLLSAEEVREVLSYQLDTGHLFWKLRPIELFNGNLRAQKSWNSRFGGKQAFLATNNNGYKVGAIFGKLYTAHRVAWCIENGNWPTLQIDHINGDRVDNRLLNLREVSNAENHKNQKTPATNTSGAVGVYLERRTGAWVAQIYHKGQRHNLGTFQNKAEAIGARKEAERAFGYHKNHGR